ncbi:MAG: ATP-binding protein [Ignavibacteriae bacterium]|nr:ATP-binding protein [Ignavibacteriota bacterium]
MVIKRAFWIKKIELAWKKRPIVWLSGVRRVGKTTIAKMFHKSVYLNCDLPSVVRRLEDPELFYNSLDSNSIIIFDEVHRLSDPSNLLKIAADSFPSFKILATGSSTLSATKKFKDSLTGRKHTIYLSPVLWNECTTEFGIKDFDKRLLHGGLPDPLLSKEKDSSFFSEWIDSFYARDIQELFSIRNRSGFLKLLNLIIRQSGGLIDYTQLAKLSTLSRPTVKSQTEAMVIAHAAFLLPPFHGGGRREIVQRPKCYAFDTGFVTFVKGWTNIREEDRGLLWEHLTLDTLRSIESESNLFYWRDKSGREIDFVIKRSENKVDTIECKINPDNFSTKSLSAFRTLYPNGNNYCISPFINDTYKTRKNNFIIEFTSLQNFKI